MALEEFEQKPISTREKNLVRMRSITNYTMGVFFIGAGVFFLFPIAATQQFINRYDSSSIKMFAVVCFIYGAFRIFRGYQKNYFKD
jgi:hypothetical protein